MSLFSSHTSYHVKAILNFKSLYNKKLIRYITDVSPAQKTVFSKKFTKHIYLFLKYKKCSNYTSRTSTHAQYIFKDLTMSANASNKLPNFPPPSHYRLLTSLKICCYRISLDNITTMFRWKHHVDGHTHMSAHHVWHNY